jgi:hypothetical protein
MFSRFLFIQCWVSPDVCGKCQLKFRLVPYFSSITSYSHRVHNLFDSRGFFFHKNIFRIFPRFSAFSFSFFLYQLNILFHKRINKKAIALRNFIFSKSFLLLLLFFQLRYSFVPHGLA